MNAAEDFNRRLNISDNYWLNSKDVDALCSQLNDVLALDREF